jgi:hypothetical protein
MLDALPVHVLDVYDPTSVEIAFEPSPDPNESSILVMVFVVDDTMKYPPPYMRTADPVDL